MPVRPALALLIVAVASVTLVVMARPDGDPARSRLLVETPPNVLRACVGATTPGVTPARCPAAIPRGEGHWSRARAIERGGCEYLIDVEPGPGSGPPRARLFHLLFGGRCGRFDLRAAGGRWPAGGHIRRDLRLVGVGVLETGRSGLGPSVRPRVIRRVRVAGRRGLLLAYARQPLTTVHTGHLAIVWNEAEAGYAVSGHPSDGATRARAVRALRAAAAAISATTPR